METPEIVKKIAAQNGLREMVFVGKVPGADVFGEAPLLDAEGDPVPTGLPRLVVLDDNGASFVEGEEALSLLGLLS